MQKQRQTDRGTDNDLCVRVNRAVEEPIATDLPPAYGIQISREIQEIFDYIVAQRVNIPVITYQFQY